MKYSSFNWDSRPAGHGGPKRGWIFGPFFGRTLMITLSYGLSAMGGGYVIVRPETTFSIVDLIADDGRDWGVSDNCDVIASFRDRSDAEMFIASKSNLTYSKRQQHE